MGRSVVIILHLGYWALFLILLLIIYLAVVAGQLQPDNLAILNNLYLTCSFAIIPGACCFYTFYFKLFHRYLYRKKILKLFCSGIICAIICAVIGALFASVIFDFSYLFADGWSSFSEVILMTSLMALLNGGMGLVMKGFITWYAEIKLKQDLQNKNYETELALIKSQLNPHFLFNTINNIDVLIEKDPVQASLYLNKLSDIMRFMLYKTRAERILLDTELEYIEKYVELQKIRTSNKNFVSLMVVGNTADCMIESMLFIPFIENAFKYADNSSTENVISIKLEIEEKSIHFSCRNTYRKYRANNIEHSGLGNELIQKRLSLLYGHRQILKITDENEVFFVDLILYKNEN